MRLYFVIIRKHLKTNRMEKTAVEWFAGEIKGGKLITNQKFEKLLQQAKEMFKQQIIDTYNKGHEAGIGDYIDNEWGSDMTELTAEQYYNEIFKDKL